MEQGNKQLKPQDQRSKASSSKAEKPPSTGSEVPCLKVVYVFAGHRRRADVREHVESLALSSGFTLDMHEFDLMRDLKHDVLQDEMWSGLKEFIRKLQPFVSSQHSRARHTVGHGISTRCRQDLVRYGADSIHLVIHGCLSLTDRKQKKEHCWQFGLGNFIYWLMRLVQLTWENLRKI